MTATQRKALELMEARNLGAVPVAGRWVFPTVIRNDRRTLTASQVESLAARVIIALESK